MKDLFKNFLSFGLATTIEKILLFLFIPIYSRFLLKEEFGVVDLLQVISEAGSILALLQLETSFQRYYLDYKSRLKRVHVTSNFIFISILSLLVVLVLFILSKPINLFFFNNYNYLDAYYLTILKIPFSNFSIIAFIILRFENQTKNFLLYVLLRSVSLLLFTLIFLNVYSNSVIAVLLAQFLSSLVTCIGLFIYMKKFIIISYSQKIIKKSLSFSIPMVPARIGSFAITYANRFFLATFLSLSAIGIYSLSLRFASAVQIIYTAFIMAWTPFLFSTIKKENASLILKDILIIVAGPVFLLVCSISIFSTELVKYFSTSEFSESGKYIGGLSLFFCLMIFKEIVDIGPKVMEKTKYITYNFFVSVFVNLVSLIILTPMLGVQGVVLSMILTNVVLVAISWKVSNNLFFVPFDFWKFILLAFPAFILTISLMNFTLSIGTRVVLFLVILLYYTLNILSSFKRGRNLIYTKK